jgi:hypothetical protein
VVAPANPSSRHVHKIGNAAFRHLPFSLLIALLSEIFSGENNSPRTAFGSKKLISISTGWPRKINTFASSWGGWIPLVGPISARADVAYQPLRGRVDASAKATPFRRMIVV